jgi:hypothetical protein
MPREEIPLQVLSAIESNTDQTQHQFAQISGVSLGKAHNGTKVLLDKGQVKMRNFSHNQKKMDYAYLLTPAALRAKLC